MIELKIYEWLTLAAIVVGPILAVVVSQLRDDRRNAADRRLKVFRDLLQTRGLRLDPVHVGALNLVDLEFYRFPDVRSSYANYISHLNSPMPPVDEQGRYFSQRYDIFLNLLAAMAKSLKFDFDKRELERNSYVPVAWDDQQELQRQNAVLLNQLLSGQRNLPISTYVPASSPFPEPPQVDEIEHKKSAALPKK
jgi:hypothetical protein